VTDIAELGERIHLALKILRGKDTPLVRHVRREIRIAAPKLEQHFVDITRVFCLVGYSKSAPMVVSRLAKVLTWEILTSRIKEK
jgi:hypothetical protein